MILKVTGKVRDWLDKGYIASADENFSSIAVKVGNSYLYKGKRSSSGDYVRKERLQTFLGFIHNKELTFYVKRNPEADIISITYKLEKR